MAKAARGEDAWCPRKNGDLWIRKQDEGTAVYNAATARLHLLNASAIAIWEACDGQTTVAEIVGAVIELTGLSAEAATAEVTNVLQEMMRAGLVS